MAFWDKLGEVAKNIGDKTEDAIEITKLNSKIRGEKAAAAEDLKKIGEFYYQRFVSGVAVDPQILEHCQSAKTHFDAVADAQAEIKRIKAEGGKPGAPEEKRCPACGAAYSPDVNFCAKCGVKLEQSAEEPAAQSGSTGEDVTAASAEKPCGEWEQNTQE